MPKYVIEREIPGAGSLTPKELTAISQTALRSLPQGTFPPLIISYSASSVPILQLALSGKTLSEQELNDLGLNFIRTKIVTVQGAAVPYPYGGKQRQVQVDLNTTALQARGLSARPVRDFTKASLDDIQPFIELGIGNDQGRQEADHVAVGTR